jgi:hypothetical protein
MTTTALSTRQGGTGLRSTTAYALFCGGTTSTANLQQVASVGSLGQVLKSNGASALPSFENNVLQSNSSADLIGYYGNAFGTVTQATSKTTAVTINKPSGVITTSDSQLNNNATVVFTVNNNLVEEGYVATACTGDQGTAANYLAQAMKAASGSFKIRLTNLGADASEAVPINFFLTKLSAT